MVRAVEVWRVKQDNFGMSACFHIKASQQIIGLGFGRVRTEIVHNLFAILLLLG